MGKELADIRNDSSSHVFAETVNDDVTDLRGWFDGPSGSPYAGGKFHVSIKIPEEYPFRPPLMKFVTKIWHPNVSSETVNVLIPLITISLTSIGRHLPRHSLDRMVACLYGQVRPLVPAIPPELARAQRPTRRGRCYNADQESERV